MSDASVFKNVWCVGEIRHGRLSGSLQELLSAAKGVSESFKESVCVVLVGQGLSAHAETLKKQGVEKIYCLDSDLLENYVEDIFAKVLARHIEKEKPHEVFFSSSVMGRTWGARTAARVGTGLAVDVFEIKVEEGNLTMKRICCGGTSVVTVTTKKTLTEMATLRPGAFKALEGNLGGGGEVVKVTLEEKDLESRAKFISFDQGEEELDVSQADIVISGGNGVGGAKGFDPLKDLAKIVGGAVGASRRAVDLGWIPYKHQVGLTGKTIRPRLYVACGISGQVQHLAGMAQSETIVAINKDPEAPLMKIADFAVEGDLFEIVPALTEEIKKSK